MEALLDALEINVSFKFSYNTLLKYSLKSSENGCSAQFPKTCCFCIRYKFKSGQAQRDFYGSISKFLEMIQLGNPDIFISLL